MTASSTLIDISPLHYFRWWNVATTKIGHDRHYVVTVRSGKLYRAVSESLDFAIREAVRKARACEGALPEPEYKS